MTDAGWPSGIEATRVRCVMACERAGLAKHALALRSMSHVRVSCAARTAARAAWDAWDASWAMKVDTPPKLAARERAAAVALAAADLRHQLHLIAAKVIQLVKFNS